MEITRTPSASLIQDHTLELDTPYSIEIITDPSSLFSLKKEWSTLYDKADKPYFTQSFEWNRCSWQIVSEPRKDHLYCIIIRSEGQIVLIWPFVIRTKDHFWLIAHPLALISTEYSNALVDATQNSKALTELALWHLKKSCPCDLIQLPFTRADSLLYKTLGKTKSFTLAPYIDWSKYQDWKSYHHKLSIKLRQNLSRRARRLAELGNVEYEILGMDDAYQEEIQWLIQTKQKWAMAKNLRLPFPPNYIDFLNLVFKNAGTSGKMLICVLKLNGKTIGGKLMRVDKTRVKYVIDTYDPNFSSFSPSQLITGYCMKWAYEQHLDVDYRLGEGNHKEDWITEQCEVVNYQIYRNFFGKTHRLIRASINHIRNVVKNSKQVLNDFKKRNINRIKAN